MTKILIVEDDADEMVLLGSYFEGSGYELVYAQTLDEAVGLVQRQDLGAILLDLNLPDSLGAATFAALSEYVDGIPVVAITNSPDASLGDTLLKSGAQDFIPKTDVNRSALLLALRYAMLRQFQKEKDKARLAEQAVRNRELETELNEIWHQALRICNRVSQVVEVVNPPDDPDIIRTIRGEAQSILRRAGKVRQ